MAWNSPNNNPPNSTNQTLYINSFGNIGIGTTTPSQKLSVDGTFSVSATSTFQGNVGIMTTNPSAALEVVGKIKATNTFGTWVGNTASSYDGNRGGYDAADALCASNYAGSHVCSSAEFTFGKPTNSIWYNTYVSAYGPPSSPAWISDCYGWRRNDSSIEGTYWDGGLQSPWPQSCNGALPFACCRNN
ncbi:hypothetical protein HZB04_00705 [Candidatus Wolfebacteria bacterium]|nr:hypothetical protein [Candidatus Wolfebacteria bacterium]